MEVVNYKVLHSYYYAWIENKRVHLADVEAQIILVILESQLNGILTS